MYTPAIFFVNKSNNILINLFFTLSNGNKEKIEITQTDWTLRYIPWNPVPLKLLYYFIVNYNRNNKNFNIIFSNKSRTL